jgi:hypothetical protein
MINMPLNIVVFIVYVNILCNVIVVIHLHWNQVETGCSYCFQFWAIEKTKKHRFRVGFPWKWELGSDS